MIILVRSVVLAVVLGECIGCASLSTAHGGSDGLVYYLPKRLLIASVTMSAMDPKATDLLAPTVASVDVVVTDPFPDLSTKYVAKYNRNWVGENSIKLVSSTSGLLTTAESKTVPKIKEALASVAKAAAQISTFELGQEPKEPQKKMSAAWSNVQNRD